MQKKHDLVKLFVRFINDSKTGKRLKKNGELISKGTIDNYNNVLKNLIQFSTETNFELYVFESKKLNKDQVKAEKKYWKKFYLQFTDFMYKKGCFDNYVGVTIKTIRVFFNYLKVEKDFFIGEYHKSFYVRKQDVDIQVLNTEQLKFLIYDTAFEKELTIPQRIVKDMFVFGCATGLRFSDLSLLTIKNIEVVNEEYYLKTKSKKTKTYSSIKLPEFAINISTKFKTRRSSVKLFPTFDLSNFNEILKRIGEKAGWVHEVNITREIKGVSKINQKKKKRFCDQMSSHMMRRTAITTMLVLGMPEHLVKKISGHSHNSGSFNRYVHYAQSYLDTEIDKVHEKLNNL